MNTSKFNLQKVVRKNIAALKPYSTARDEYTGTALVQLDANENPYSSIDGKHYNRYPDPHQLELKQVVAKLKGVSESKIFLGNGSDEAIHLLYAAFCEPASDNIIICPPTYGMYQVSADTHNVACKEVRLTSDFQLDTDSILNSIDAHTKIIWICSPNNPTANALHTKDILKIIENSACIVVIDEAYIDYSSQESFTALLDRYSNLVVMHTFSKAWGLANIRLGMMFASAEIINIINSIKLPYNISGLVQEYALEVLSNPAHIALKNKLVEETLQQRKKLSAELLQFSDVVKIYESDANFILVTIKNARSVYESLVKQGIIVRDRSGVILCENSLRITIGTPEENILLVNTLREILA